MTLSVGRGSFFHADHVVRGWRDGLDVGSLLVSACTQRASFVFVSCVSADYFPGRLTLLDLKLSNNANHGKRVNDHTV